MDVHEIGDGTLLEDWTRGRDVVCSGYCAGFLFFLLAGGGGNQLSPGLLVIGKGTVGGHYQDSLDVRGREEKLVGGW